MSKNKILLFILAGLFSLTSYSQERDSSLLSENSKKEKISLKLTGYMQGQYQWGQTYATLNVGSPNDFSYNSFSRIGLRRGFLRLSASYKLATAVVMPNITEKGIGLIDAYFSIKEPWLGSCSLKVGLFGRPFGHEIGYSSSLRESPERSIIVQTLFPQVSDIGLNFTFQMPDTSPWSLIKLDLGLLAGNAANIERDSKRDFISRLSINKSWYPISISGGVSYYLGGVYQGTPYVFTIQNDHFVMNNKYSNQGEFAKREYLGFDFQLFLESIVGRTSFRTEFIMGTQPGFAYTSVSPHSVSLPTDDTYIRPFRGGYALLSQYLGGLPVALVAKYEWYDPNTALDGDNIGVYISSVGDIRRERLGLGALLDITSYLKMTLFYDLNKNETTASIRDYNTDLKDDVLTLRLQYKF